MTQLLRSYSVSRYAGLFFFDSSFRPVPLEQHFIGVKGKPGTPQSRKNLDQVTFEKVSELVKLGHQVMVFVHARKETVKAAQTLKEAATFDDCLDDFSCEDHPSYGLLRREIAESRNQEMRQLFDFGFGIHHAGMLRSDRNMMERMFEARAIKVFLHRSFPHPTSLDNARSFVVQLHWLGVSTFPLTQVRVTFKNLGNALHRMPPLFSRD